MQATKIGKLLEMKCLALMALALTGCMPAGPRALWDGKKLLDRGRYQEAVARLTVAVQLLNTNAQAWNYLGVARHQTGDSAGAVQAYQQAIKLDRGFFAAHFNLGCLWLDLKKLESARNEFLACTVLQGNAPEAWAKLGVTQLRQGDWAGASDAFQKCLRVSPDFPEALNGLGLVNVQRRHPREAVQFFTAALKSKPTYRPALLNLATVLHRELGDTNAAAQRYREYLALQPREADWDSVNDVFQSLNPPRTPAPTVSAVTNSSTPAVAKAAPVAPDIAKVETAKAGASGIFEPGKTTPAKPEPSKPTPANVGVPNLPETSLPQATPPSAPAVQRPMTASTSSSPAVVPPRVTERTNGLVSDAGRPSVAAPTPAVTAPPAVGLVEAPPPRDSAAITNEASPPPEKRRWLSRLGLFRREPKPPPKVTVLPEAQQDLKATPLTSVGRDLSAFPRYRYQRPSAPQPGDRSAAEADLIRGEKLRAANQLAEARSAFQAAVGADAAYFEARYALALAQYASQDYAGALGTWEVALAIRPDSSDASYGFAVTLKAAGFALDAAAELEKLLAARPTESRAHLVLANLWADQLQDTAKARVHYQRVLELEPHHPQAAQIRYWLVAHSP